MSDSIDVSNFKTMNDHDSVIGILGNPAPTVSLEAESGVSYESRLSRNPRWALSEGSRHFEGKSAVFEALHKVAKRLEDLDIPYAIVGGMALFHHGLRRFTEDVDILVTKANLKKAHDKLDGLGYLPPHKHSKNLRDTEFGVRIEFLTTGDYPGDGKEKPVAFPDPEAVSIWIDGVRYINLPTLVELKLASGMTSPGRMKDLSDVLELIKSLDLRATFADQLNPYVREKYMELWGQAKKRFVMHWRNPGSSAHAGSIGDMIASLRNAAETLETMRLDGLVLDNPGGLGDDYARLVTTDPDVAKKYDMVEESEFWDGDLDESENGGTERDPNDEHSESN